MKDDPHDLRRFVDAQDGVYARARDELADGEKRTHWMWFVFPQLRGLGRSATAQRYGIASEREALAYWEHPLLGPRLKDCTELVAAIEGRTSSEIFGAPDDLKFRSSMPLFAWTVPTRRCSNGRSTSTSTAKPIRRRSDWTCAAIHAAVGARQGSRARYGAGLRVRKFGKSCGPHSDS